MTRITFLALFGAAAVGLARASAEADLPVAPAPRAIRPDGTRDPVPPPEPPSKAEDPTVVVDRIIRNSKDVGDKLAKTDTGTETRNTQDRILKDIDALINRQEDPPPPKPDDNKDKEKEKNKDLNNDPMPPDTPPKGGDMPMGGMGMGKPDGMPMGGMPMGGMGMKDPPPMGGNQPGKGDPKGGAKQDPKGGDQKAPAGGSKDPKEPKKPGDPSGGGGGKMPPKASLPFDEDVAKDVWGHLPPKLRQEMAQYYKEDVMPKYAELLRLYYSSLADKGATPAPSK